MRCRMIECNGVPALFVDLCFDSITHPQFSGIEHSHMCKRRADLARVADRETRPGAARSHAEKHAGITDLAAAFGVKRRVVQHHLTFLPRPHYINEGAVENQRSHQTPVGQAVIAQEFRLAASLTESRSSEPNLLAARARSRCASIAASKPAWSIVRPRSRATSAVRSSGKPYVSYSRNTVSPGITLDVSLVASASSSAMPVASVSANRSSSCRRTWVARGSPLTSSV